MLTILYLVFGGVLLVAGFSLIVRPDLIQRWTLGVYERYGWLGHVPVAGFAGFARTRFFIWQLRLTGVIYLLALALLVWGR